MQTWLSAHQEVLVLCSFAVVGHLRRPGQLLPRDCSGFGGTPCRADEPLDLWATQFADPTEVHGIHVWKILVGMIIPNIYYIIIYPYGKIKDVPNHQPDVLGTKTLQNTAKHCNTRCSLPDHFTARKFLCRALHSNARSQSSGDPPSHGSTMCKAPSTILDGQKSLPLERWQMWQCVRCSYQEYQPRDPASWTSGESSASFRTGPACRSVRLKKLEH